MKLCDGSVDSTETPHCCQQGVRTMFLTLPTNRRQLGDKQLQ